MMTAVTSNIFTRVMIIRTPIGKGTAFTIEVDERQYLITARHVLPDTPTVTFSVEIGDQPLHWLKDVKPLDTVHPNADVAVLPLAGLLTPTYPIVPSTAGVIVSQDVYFLGYPAGLPNYSPPAERVAFVKKGILSAFHTTPQGVQLLYVDGFNNSGFSGGPVVFYRAGTETPPYGDLHVGAIISARVRSEEENGLESVAWNSGILVATDIAHAVDAIRSAVTPNP
jgi:Trypsin-like peptidase domain